MYSRYLIITFILGTITVFGIVLIHKHYAHLTLLERTVIQETPLYKTSEDTSENEPNDAGTMTLPAPVMKDTDKTSETPSEAAPLPPAPPPLPVVETAPPSSQNIDQEDQGSTKQLTFSDINLRTREALVNIFCTTKGPHETITPISGSGIIIDERGVILTNAHIGQYFLLKDFPSENFVNCLIRTGSPAEAQYRATLLYLSPQWLAENANVISLEHPMGTGEHDFALLLINEALNNNVLPEKFPAVPVDTDESKILPDMDVLIGAYPAGFLGDSTIQKNLFIVTSIVKIAELFTFGPGTLDVVSLGGSIVAQQGSSGGAVVNALGKLIALISTSSDGDTTGERDLRAITLAHIERSLVEYNKTTLEELLSGNIAQKAASFNATVAPTLLQILVNAL